MTESIVHHSFQLWFFDPTSSFSAETRAIKTCAYPKKLLFGPLR